MTITSMNQDIEDRKVAALTELREHQERKRLANEASAEARIERAVQAARAEQEREEQQKRTSAELARIMRDHQAKVDAASEEHRAKQRAGIRPRGWTRPPEHEVAKLLRARLGDEAVSVVAKLRTINLEQLALALDQLPHEERAEALNRERAALAAGLAEAAKTLPEPEDDEESAILSSYGFPVERRQAELDAGAL